MKGNINLLLLYGRHPLSYNGPVHLMTFGARQETVGARAELRVSEVRRRVRITVLLKS